MYCFERQGALAAKPRQGVHLNLIGGFDGNVLGGLAVGAGMALTGACPGTAIVQLAQGVPSAPYVVTGAVIGGVVYDTIFMSRIKSRQLTAASVKRDDTIMEKAQLDHEVVLLGFEIVTSFIVTIAALSSTSRSAIHPIVGGLFIGIAQLVTLWLTGSLVGVSTAYEAIGRAISSFFALLIGKERRLLNTAQQSSIVFAAGLFLSGLAFQRKGVEMSIPPLQAVIGGVLSSLGSRIAGGCTSGHGISGVSMFSISSLITVASMFLGGMSLGAFLW